MRPRCWSLPVCCSASGGAGARPCVTLCQFHDSLYTCAGREGKSLRHALRMSCRRGFGSCRQHVFLSASGEGSAGCRALHQGAVPVLCAAWRQFLVRFFPGTAGLAHGLPAAGPGRASAPRGQWLLRASCPCRRVWPSPASDWARAVAARQQLPGFLSVLFCALPARILPKTHEAGYEYRQKSVFFR